MSIKNENEICKIIAFCIGVLIAIAHAGNANAQNPYIPLQIQPVQIMTPYELQGIDNYEQRRRENQYRYEQRLRDLQQYQQQQELIDAIKWIEQNKH